MYLPQFVLIDEDNKCIATVDSLAAARRAVAEGSAASAGGRISRCLLVADIDAELPEIGDACAEPMIAWCERHRLPYLVRDSGRAGGRHVIALITHRAVPVDEWGQLCLDVSDRWGGVVSDRTGMVLRLLTAPHRLGFRAPVIACTITPRAVQDALQQPSGTHRPKKAGRGKLRASTRFDRSASEFGVTCAMVRRGFARQAAWSELVRLAGHAAERGERWFHRYYWLPAVTGVAAERGLTDDAAWELAQRACPAVCRRRGRRWWQGLWDRAVAEAATPRPRRYRSPGQAMCTPATPGIAEEVAVVRRGLAEAVQVEYADLDPRRRRSARTLLWHLAVAIVKREGSISIRDLAERSQLDPSTVQAVLRTATERGLLVIARPYSGGPRSCQAYGIGSAARVYVAAARKIVSPHTSCSTPAPHGAANLARLAVSFASARKRWAQRNDVLAVLAPGERLADSRHPAARLLRSLWYQQKWWQSLTSLEKEARRRQRRAYLGGLHRSARSAWFDWLDRRSDIVAARDRIATHAADPVDVVAVLAAPPVTVHRGLHGFPHADCSTVRGRYPRYDPMRDRRAIHHRPAATGNGQWATAASSFRIDKEIRQ
ncbi:winged helix-turn-helix domain-containing protein [Nocardia sp. NEAU-G5]|uniref:Winged helix-turn-helix domain-containing protein n=1 Tax=Nocardia albiluteola TaxID=2842303 RepID=A0ABS6AZB8_9NOCA|nr:helix-turn-helix domain-containing protein [Nocardia albiluteola]MBU3063218.1 winged helix-turn-helix domain-containing protein [Nocardia albiluteola]